MNPIQKKHGLLPKTPDARDLSRHKVLGSVAPAILANTDFLVEPPLEIMNQDINYESDFCATYAATAASEAKDGVTEVPEYTFAHAKKLLVIKQFGANPTEQEIDSVVKSYGLELRDVMVAGVSVGFLERQYDPFKCDTDDRPARDYIADYRNWPADLDALAFEHAKGSFLALDGPYDTFDNIRSALFANEQNRGEFVVGMLWRSSWSQAPGGVIYQGLYQQSEPGSGHAFTILGQSMTEKGLCLVAQLSDSAIFGDHGLFYFDRATVNAEVPNFGAYMFSNIPKAKAQIHNDFNFTVNATAWQKFWAIAVYFIKRSPVLGNLFK